MRRLERVGDQFTRITSGVAAPDAPSVSLIPGYTPTSDERASADAFLNPHDHTLHAERRRAAAVRNTLSAAGSAEQHVVGNINEPASYLLACPHAAAAAPAPTAPARGLGEHVVVDTTALMALHTKYRHGEGTTCPPDCYIHTLALHAGGHVIPYHKQPALTAPTPPLPSAQAAAAGTEAADLDEAVAKLTVLGVVGTLEDQTAPAFTSRVSMAYKHSILLTPEEQARCDEAPATATYAAIARGYAAKFMLLLTTALAALTTPVPDTPNNIYSDIFWNALGGVFYQHSPRFVFDGRGINEYISRWPISYPRLSELFQTIKPGSWAAKVDLVKGFYAIVMDPSTYRHLTFWHNGRLHFFKRLPMGLASSPAVFCWLTAEINAWLRAAGSTASIVFVDDFLIVGDTQRDTQAALELLISLITQLGLKHSIEKSSAAAAQYIDMLGVSVDTSALSITAPAAAFVKFFALASIVNACAAAQLPVPFKILARLAGCLNWAEIIYKHLAPFTQPLAAFATKRDGAHKRRWWRGLFQWTKSVDGSASIIKALGYVLRLAHTASPARILCNSTSTRLRHIYIASDASGDTLTVSVNWGPYAIHCTVEAGHGWDVPALEFLAAVLVAILWGPRLRGAIIHHALDALGVTYWGNSGRARRADALLMLKIISRCHHYHGIEDAYHWVRRCFNHANDVSAGSTATHAAAIHFEHLYHIDLAGPATECLPKLLVSQGMGHVMEHINE